MPATRERPHDVHLRSAPQLLEYESIVERIVSDRPGRVLDWGAGFGQITHRLVEEGLEVTAFDYREDLEVDGVYPFPRYPDLSVHLSSDPVALPFESQTFDAVLSCGVLEHVARPDESLREIRRVLRPGGTLYVYKLPNRFSYLEKLARLGGLYYHGRNPHDAVYTCRSARALLERNGFQVSELRRANVLPLTLSGRAAIAAAGPIWHANRALSRVPALNVLATNIELIARAV